MSFSFVRSSVDVQSPSQTLAVAVYELAACIDSRNRNLWDDAKAEYADFISMIRMYGEQRGIDVDNLDRDKYAYQIEPGLTGSLAEHVYVGLGRVVQCDHYDNVYGEGKHKHSPILKHVGKLWYLTGVFAAVKGWPIYELYDLGEERYRDRMSDIRKYGDPKNFTADTLREVFS
jgi:hypothetical protein